MAPSLGDWCYLVGGIMPTSLGRWWDLISVEDATSLGGEVPPILSGGVPPSLDEWDLLVWLEGCQTFWVMGALLLTETTQIGLYSRPVCSPLWNGGTESPTVANFPGHSRWDGTFPGYQAYMVTWIVRLKIMQRLWLNGDASKLTFK